MLRPVENPPGRFVATAVEWDIPPPPAHLQVFEDDSRGILARNESPDLHHRWSLNPYRGCTHACTYCYARPSHEYLAFGAGTDFESRIVVKPRAAELLAEAFEERAWEGESVLFSGNVDCYQPLEHRYGLTRACLAVCLRYRNPVALITKSSLIERDLDLLVQLHAVARVRVLVSIPFWDPTLSRAIEPGAPLPARRFRAIAALARAGIPVGVNVAPVIPGLNDRDLPRVLEAAREAGATGAGMILVRLPPAVAPYFESTLRARLPTRADGVLARIRRMRQGALYTAGFGDRMRGSGPEWEVIERLFAVTTERLGLARRPADGGEPEPPTTFRRPGEGRQLGLFGG